MSHIAWLYNGLQYYRPPDKSAYWKIIFLNYVVGTQKEPSQWDGSFEHPKHMFKLMGKEINAILGAQTNHISTFEFTDSFAFNVAVPFS